MFGLNKTPRLTQSSKKNFKSFFPQRERKSYYKVGFGSAGRRTLINFNTPQKLFIMRALIFFTVFVLLSAIVYAATRLNSGKVLDSGLGAVDRPLCKSLSVIIDETDRMAKEHLEGIVKEIKFKLSDH